MADNDNSHDFKLVNSTSHLLHRAQQMAAERFAKLAADKGVTLRQFAVLAAVSEKPGLSQTELVQITGVDRSTLADMVTRMEKRGWLARTESDADARANCVSLTPAGKSIFLSAVASAKAADAAVLDALKGQQRKSFQNLLTLLAEKSDKDLAKAEEKAKKLARKQARLEAKAREREEKRRQRQDAKAKAKAKAEKAPKLKRPNAKKPARKAAPKTPGDKANGPSVDG